MKVTLIHPSFDAYFTYDGPVGLAYLQAAVKKAGHEVSIIDNNIFNMNAEDLAEKCRTADVVGITMTTPTFTTVRNFCKLLQSFPDRPKIVLGGAHPTINSAECLEFADFVVIGEGEKSFVELLENFSSKQKDENLHRIKGIAFRSGEDVVITENRAFNQELDQLAFPDWTGFPIEKYGSALRVSGRSLPIVTSRGCPYQCIYCFKGLFGKVFRARSPKSVVDEIEYLKKEFAIREFQIADDAFAANKKRAKEICQEIIARKINLPWSMPNGIRADSLDEELVSLMKKAGLQYTGIGIESGNQQILKNIQKSQTKDAVRKAVKILQKYKIETVGFFMFGLPGDTVKTMRETARFARSLNLDYCSISMTTPYPGTQLYQDIQNKKGIFLTKSPDELFSLGSSCKYLMPGMATKEEIEKEYRNARIKLLLRPRTILHTLLKRPGRIFSGLVTAYKWIFKT